MSLDLDISLRQGAFKLQATLASDERVIGLFGPSGAGKSSLLRVIAGLARPDAGHVRINGRDVFDSRHAVNTPTHRRRLGVVFQQPRLFAHLNVTHNLTYGRWFARKRASRARFDHVVEMLDIGALLTRRTAALSGGEAQRVAIGRALLSEPDMLLLDEPLAALDVARRAEVLPYIERLGAETELPIVFVTHQLDELLRLANRYVAAVDDGRVVFAGPTADFLARPELLGDTGYHEAGTLLRARPIAHQAVDGLSVLALGDQRLYVPQLDANNTGDEITVHVRALDVILAREVPADMSALNRLAARITGMTETADGQGVEVRLDVAGQRLDARITRFSAPAMRLAPGDTVTAIIKSLALAEQAWQRLGGL
ncbi:molybdenum ABC transporter ATP-binding protein [Salinisphaera japonica]|uniref:Molybdenum ABC transporter ATP-binding protein n=1 Tax=Salinisphaera japonica YTM-1 TaxID=1209778 RepID=A0A423PDZ0_9GAMM|nr:molybdenum ABC transporter ATP-binding protein [Salinisphaera japonica]ROO23807.1 molybdenum ABC transporter ATP-binding protein [Salinisphaera japonica YTM-1]